MNIDIQASKNLAEVLDRVIRTESRLVQLGDYVGANLRSRQKIEICRPDLANAGHPYVLVDSLDVSASRILTELRQANVHVHDIDVFVGDRRVFTLYPLNQG